MGQRETVEKQVFDILFSTCACSLVEAGLSEVEAAKIIAGQVLCTDHAQIAVREELEYRGLSDGTE